MSSWFSDMPAIRKQELRSAFIQAKQQGRSISEIARFFGVKWDTVNNAMKRFEETGSNKNREGSGRRRSARDEETVFATALAITADPSTKRNSTRKLSKKLGISRKFILFLQLVFYFLFQVNQYVVSL